MDRKRLLRVAGLLAASGLVADQLVQWTALRDGFLAGRRIAPFDPPLFDAAQQAKLEAIRARLGRAGAERPWLDFDAELGWCTRADSADGPCAIDWAGARIVDAPLAREADPARARVVAVGDSFVFGDEVGPRETWLAALGRARPELELANLGVGGYDLAQSLGRWRRDGAALKPRELWVGFVPSQVLRNVTTYVPAWRHWTPIVAFKPRAELAADGALRTVPCPVRSLVDLVECLEQPARFRDAVAGHDRWVDAWPSAYAAFGSSPLHYSATARVLLTAFERGGREPRVELERPGSEVVALFAAQLGALARELAPADVRLRVLVLPDRGDLAGLRAQGRSYWEGLVQRLQREGLELFDASHGLLAAGCDADPAAWAPQGHYSARTNGILAGLVDAHLCAHPR